MYQQNVSPPAHRALLVLTPGLLALGAAAALVLRVAALVGTTAVWRVDDVVALAVVVLGALAALWVGLSAAVASLCVLARAAGRTWRAGEHAVERWGPGIVRRALTVLVAAGVGLGAATGAQASADPAPSPVVVDLGWAPTTQGAERTGDGTTTDDAATTTTTPVAPADDAAGAPAESDPAAPATGTGSTAARTAAPVEQAPATPEAPAPARAVGHGPSSSGTSSRATSSRATSSQTTSSHTTSSHTTSSPAASTATDGDRAAGPAAPTAGSGTTSTVTATEAPAAPSGVTGGGTVVVRAGDTLWSLTARHLGQDASDAEIAAAWPRWYSANAAVIGPDPDLLHPGQVLVVPATTDGSTR